VRGVFFALLLLSACKPEPTARLSAEALKRESGGLCLVDGGTCVPPMECVEIRDYVGRTINRRCLLTCRDSPDCPAGFSCVIESHGATQPFCDLDR
jgi:hypothetical protein